MNLMEMVGVHVAQGSTCVVKGKETATVILNALGILSVGQTIVTLLLAFLLTVIAVMTLTNVRKCTYLHNFDSRIFILNFIQWPYDLILNQVRLEISL